MKYLAYSVFSFLFLKTLSWNKEQSYHFYSLHDCHDIYTIGKRALPHVPNPSILLRVHTRSFYLHPCKGGPLQLCPSGPASFKHISIHPQDSWPLSMTGCLDFTICPSSGAPPGKRYAHHVAPNPLEKPSSYNLGFCRNRNPRGCSWSFRIRLLWKSCEAAWSAPREVPRCLWNGGHFRLVAWNYLWGQES